MNGRRENKKINDKIKSKSKMDKYMIGRMKGWKKRKNDGKKCEDKEMKDENMDRREI